MYLLYVAEGDGVVAFSRGRNDVVTKVEGVLLLMALALRIVEAIAVGVGLAIGQGATPATDGAVEWNSVRTGVVVVPVVAIIALPDIGPSVRSAVLLWVRGTRVSRAWSC